MFATIVTYEIVLIQLDESDKKNIYKIYCDDNELWN